MFNPYRGHKTNNIMKTIEEKARAYDEALERAKAAIDIAADKDLVKGVATTIFPELRESEDERNIDTIFNCLYQCCDTGFISGTQRDNALAYLEKQKEQKPAEWSKQQVVNALTSMLNERITPFHQKSLDETIGDKEKMFMDALVEMRSFVNSPSFDIGKENSAEWSEEDEIMLDAIIRDVMTLHNAKNIDELKDKIGFLKSVRSQLKQE